MIAHLDCSTGISGDKFLGALLDAGFAETRLLETLAPLGIAADAVVIERVHTHGIAATSVRLAPADGSAPAPARHLSDVLTSISSADMPPAVAANAAGVFELLADAEARVHGTAVEEVHFHEVGALDAILDIVGVALGLHALEVTTLTATPPALGAGTANTSHGALPVPAPATAELLRGIPTTPGPSLPGGGDAGELTTPTGAALLRAFATGYGPAPAMTASAIGYGAGTRDIGAPNIARIVIGEPASSAGESFAGLTLERITLLETNIDHLTPEQLAFCAEELVAEGALDVWQTPIVMKKGRAAVALSLMCPPAEADRLAARVHALTGTLGVRRSDIERTVAAREERTLDTRHGPVRAKLAAVAGEVRARAEHDDVARIARELGRPIAEVALEIAADLAAAVAGL